ncbi:UNVERIFIED_CONTAM: hypothetical protein Sangu_2946700 [Sesamum angustifolium]|uniref:Uncharacterized protein n=1 Tax=Sesamum angustifolium TaxID=2727405 RepID=A0AAW2IKG3_9LAMI
MVAGEAGPNRQSRKRGLPGGDQLVSSIGVGELSDSMPWKRRSDVGEGIHPRQRLE